MEEKQKVLKVSDLVEFSEKDYAETKRCLDKMNKMVLEYVSLNNTQTDLDRLEELKREFNSYLVYFGTYYSKVKCFQENFQYLDSQRKRVKSEAIEHMIKNSDEKLSHSAAEKVVYAYPYYVERMRLIESIKQFFILVDTSYDNYKDVLRSIYQTVAHAQTEKRNSSGV